MAQLISKWRVAAPIVGTEKVLEAYYGQFLEWGTLLTRGDLSKAQDIVHDFCLYFTLTKPDLSGITNLDGYLYTSLRHFYLSSLARSSRESLLFIDVADFDSIQFALTSNRSGDPLQKQNDLRRICCYSVWRKQYSKSFSYFILHFFHGYFHREIADLACVPISTIYRKLNTARTEIKSHSEAPTKVASVNREVPPEPTLLWNLLSSAQLFKELRETILNARTSDCLPEDELLAHYSAPIPKPISCSLLSHIVSCENCLAVIDRHFRWSALREREPFDGRGAFSDENRRAPKKTSDAGRKALLRSIHRHKDGSYEHRPKALFIAVDGKIIAFHDVRSEHSALSARIDHPENTQFVEVFSEQDLRLAFLPIGTLPPNGPHAQTQRITLSDDRWLELNLTFDGLGLNSEVTYFDPALAIDFLEEDAEDLQAVPTLEHVSSRPLDGILAWPRAGTLFTPLARFFRPIVPSSVMAWALGLAIASCTTSYLVYRHQKMPLNAHDILSQSVRIEGASLKGQTEHEVLRFEEASADGLVSQHQTIDLWRDGDGSRYMRRLYDAQHRLIAAEWRQRNGERGRYPSVDNDNFSDTAHSAQGTSWMQDVSSSDFSTLVDGQAQIRPAQDGYELTSSGPIHGHPELISVTLSLNHDLHPVRETVRMRNASKIGEARFVQVDYERQPSSSIPDAIFDPQDQGLRSAADRPNRRLSVVASNAQLTALHIAVLYQLSNLNADTSEPIDVVRTPDGYIRVSGTVTDDARKQEILSHLKLLSNHELLKLQIVLPRDFQASPHKVRSAASETMSVYNIDQSKPLADTTVRKYFHAQGLSGKPLDAAVANFSREAVDHAQRALQHASALNRLGNSVPAAELRAVNFAVQQQWTGIVLRHANALEVEFRALHEQLAKVSIAQAWLPATGGDSIKIDNPAQFSRTVHQLLRQTQSLNANVGDIFASGQSESTSSDIDSLIATASNAIPLREAVEITSFAVQLSSSERTAQMNRQHDRSNKAIPNEP